VRKEEEALADLPRTAGDAKAQREAD